MIKEKTIETYFLNKNELDIQKVIDDYYNYVGTIVKNFPIISLEDEEEIISDVFFIVWKNKDNLEKSLNFSPYIAGVTKKVIYKKYKKDILNKNFEEFDENIISNFNTENVLEEKEFNDCIIKNLKSIGQTEYLIFIKFYYEDKKVKDIAKELGLSVSNVKTILHRTRKKVKEMLRIGGFC